MTPKQPSQQLFWLLLSLFFGLVISLALSALLPPMAAQTAMQVLCFLTPALLAAWLSGSMRSALRLDFRPGRWWASLMAVAAFLLLVPGLDVLSRWNDGLPLPGEEHLRAAQQASERLLHDWLYRPGCGALVANLVVMALVPALCEECFFRAGLLRIILRWTHRPGLALCLTALLFSLAHGDLFGFLPRFVMGLMLGLLFLRTGSLLVNTLAHFANNALIVLLAGLYANGHLSSDLASSPLPSPPLLTVACTLASLAVLWLALRRRGSLTQD